MTLREALDEYVHKKIPIQSYLAEVLAVDAEAGVCDLRPLDGSADLLDARLIATQGGQGLVLVPRVGSVVIAASIRNSRVAHWVAQCTELDSLRLQVGDSTPGVLEIDASGVLTLNGGSLGGLVKIAELTAELNKLKAFCDTLRTALAATVIVPNDGGAAIKTALGNALAMLDTGTFGPNLEDTRVKH